MRVDISAIARKLGATLLVFIVLLIAVNQFVRVSDGRGDSHGFIEERIFGDSFWVWLHKLESRP